MGKSLLNLIIALVLIFTAQAARAQVYRYNPQTGNSENIAKPTVSAAPQPTAGGVKKPASGSKRVTPDEIKEIQQAVAASNPGAVSTEDSTSTQDLISAVNKSIADEEARADRKMGPMGRIGIIIDPEQHNPTLERNLVELSKIPDLDKLYMNPPAHIGQLMYILKWQGVDGLEFIQDDKNLVQKKFNVPVPGFVYLRPDGSHTSYSLTDLAPFYEALTVQRRKTRK